MKKILFFSIALLVLSACATQTLSTSSQTMKKKKVTTAELLTIRLASIQKKGYMAGHQDDPFYGINWSYEPNRSDILETTGDYPAVMGFDLGGIEKADSKNLDSVPFNLIHDEAIRHAERGGIVTFSWHPRNPLPAERHGM